MDEQREKKRTALTLPLLPLYLIHSQPRSRPPPRLAGKQFYFCLKRRGCRRARERGKSEKRREKPENLTPLLPSTKKKKTQKITGATAAGAAATATGGTAAAAATAGAAAAAGS